MTELRVEYHQRLNDIDAAVQRMLSIVEQDILNAGTAFLDADEKAAAAVEANDHIVADTYQQVEQLVMNQFVRQAPAASIRRPRLKPSERPCWTGMELPSPTFDS